VKVRAGIAAGLVLALAACAGATDVVNTGPDTFLVASHGTMGWSSGGAQKAAAIQKASDYCKGVGKQLQLMTARETNGGGFGQIAAGEAEFRCVAP
jgi:hypothetical protein